MSRLRAMLAALGLTGLIVLAARAQGGPPEAHPAPRRGDVTILHSNDWHGYAIPEIPRRRRGRKRPKIGGAAAVAAAFEKVKAQVGADKVLALDAGDLLSGQAGAALVEDGVVGATFLKCWNGIGYDAWVIGNHDFDYGRANAEALVKLAKPVCLVANLYRKDDGKPVLAGEPFRVFERGGLKVGVIGLITADLARLTSAETMAGMRVFPLAEAARPHAERLEKECDLVVALTHAGLDADRELARAVPQLDVIVGGHSHTRLEKPALEGTCVIVQAGAHGREYGRLDLTVEDGRVVKHRGFLTPALAEGVTPNAAMADSLEKIEAHMVELEREVIGETTQALTRGNYYSETLVGSFVADAVREAAKADVGLMNSGGVRADFPKGRVSRAQLLRVMPNDNALATFEATGAELEAICLHNARAAVTQDHGVLQVGGVRYRWRRVREGTREDAQVLKVEVAGKPLEREKTYLCATNDFIANEQATKYLGFEPKKRQTLAKGVHAALLEAFKRGPIEVPDRGRMIEEKEGAPAPEPEKPGPVPATPGKPGDDDGGD